MIKKPNKFFLWLSGTFVIAALVIIADLFIPGKILIDEILDIKTERQQYYNAARNYHYSYKIITADHQFWVSEDFAESAQESQEIEYSVSRIFREVNWYRMLTTENRAVYSLRIISGLIIPLMTIISIGIAYRFKKNIGILVFVLQILLMGNLIYLMI